MLVFARILQGLGGGGLLSLTYALVRQSVTARANARYQGYLAAVSMCASSMGPVIGGIVTLQFGWRSVFLLNLPIGLVGLVLLFRLPPRRNPRYPLRFDWGSLAFVALGMIALLVLVDILRRSAESSSSVAVACSLTAGLCGTFIALRPQYRNDPLIPAVFFSNRTIWRSEVLALFHGALYVSLMTFVPIYLGMTHATNAAEVGLLMLPMTIGVGTGSFLTGYLVSITGKTAIFPTIGLLIVTAILAGLSYWSPTLTTGAVVVCLSLVAMAMGTVMGIVQIIVMAEAGSKMLGIASSSITLSRSLGASVGTALVGAVMQALIGAEPPAPSGLALHSDLGGAFQGVFLTIAAFSACACAFMVNPPADGLIKNA
jgi:MFS family permease